MRVGSMLPDLVSVKVTGVEVGVRKSVCSVWVPVAASCPLEAAAVNCLQVEWQVEWQVEVNGRKCGKCGKCGKWWQSGEG